MGMSVCVVQLGGIVTPNDGHCHLDRQGLYTESLNQVSLHVCSLVRQQFLASDIGGRRGSAGIWPVSASLQAGDGFLNVYSEQHFTLFIKDTLSFDGIFAS